MRTWLCVFAQSGREQPSLRRRKDLCTRPAYDPDIASILVIDGDRVVRTLITTLLRRANAFVECVPDGSDAFARVAAGGHDVIILDLVLPSVSGFEVLHRIAREAPEKLSRIIILTTVSSEAVRHLPVCRVMRKPFDIEDLLEAVEDCMAGVTSAPRARARR